MAATPLIHQSQLGVFVYELGMMGSVSLMPPGHDRAVNLLDLAPDNRNENMGCSVRDRVGHHQPLQTGPRCISRQADVILIGGRAGVSDGQVYLNIWLTSASNYLDEDYLEGQTPEDLFSFIDGTF